MTIAKWHNVTPSSNALNRPRTHPSAGAADQYRAANLEADNFCTTDTGSGGLFASTSEGEYER